MTPTTVLDDLRLELRVVLDQAETWLRRIAAVPGGPGEAGQEADTMRRLRTRAASSLINVALLGAFSSGKSFLLSGLQGHLELITVPGAAPGLSSEKFIGLLPSSPVPTTACPATVEPVAEDSPFDASGNGFLRVQFVDSDSWEDVGNSPAPSVVAAYAMQDSDIADRLRPHRDREVAEIEILLSDHRIPAKLYDLPGYGSPNPVHDGIVKSAMFHADCFIYVSHASRSLSENDLDLIRFLYGHYLIHKKRVVWVITAIDSATQLDHRNIPAWQATIDRNNAYLRQHFTVSGQPDLGFIGEGFVPVSPASEARATGYAARGEAATARVHQAESRMEPLRETLNGLIERETGRGHLAAVAGEARTLLAPRARAITERLLAERLPIDELEGLRRSQRERLRQLDEAIPRLREQLERDLQNHVKRAARPFTRLASQLHAALDDKIRAGDIRRPTRANFVQVAKEQALTEWAGGPNGPTTLWNTRLAQFKEDIVREVRELLGNEDPAGRLPEYTFDIADLDVPARDRPRSTTQDVVQRTAALLGVSAPVAALGSWMGGVATAGLVFPPAGVILGVSALVYMGVTYRKNRATSLEVMQEEWIQGLDEEAKEIQRQFELAVGLQGMDVIDALTDNLVAYRAELEESGRRVEERIAQPETQGRQELVDLLAPLHEDGERLVSALRAIASGQAAP